MEMFEVGGCVRDEILGIPSKDIDFTVVLDPSEIVPRRGKGGKLIPQTPFEVMEAELVRRGFRIFVRTPQFLTIRAMFPRPGGNLALIKNEWAGLSADFVLARKEGDYSDGRRPDAVEVGTLMDDLARRDFTMNAIAKDAGGNLIDPFGGKQDIAHKMIKAVGDPFERIVSEDALRGLRAIRFSVTKGFFIAPSVQEVLASKEFRNALSSISTERIQNELDKAFKVDTVETLTLLDAFSLVSTIFGRDRLHLVTSMKG